jgi:hypothetical protein
MRRASAAIGTVTLVLGLAGCADSGPRTDPLSLWSPTPTASMVAKPRTGAELARMVAAAVNAKGVARTTFSVRGPHDTMSGSGVIRFKNGEGQSADLSYTLTRQNGPQRYRLIIVGELLYLKPPPGTPLPPGKSWIRVRVGASDPVSRSFLPLVSEVTQFDPTSNLGALKQVRTLRVLGEETTGGTTTTHYTARLDLPLLGDVFGPGAGRGAQYELWVDGTGLPTKYRVSTRLPRIGIMTFAGTLTDWGQDVPVRTPPAATVANAETLS